MKNEFKTNIKSLSKNNNKSHSLIKYLLWNKILLVEVERAVLINSIHSGCGTGLGTKDNYFVNNVRDVIYKIMQTSTHFDFEELPLYGFYFVHTRTTLLHRTMAKRKLTFKSHSKKKKKKKDKWK